MCLGFYSLSAEKVVPQTHRSWPLHFTFYWCKTQSINKGINKIIPANYSIMKKIK